jgi:hypothetical protein
MKAGINFFMKNISGKKVPCNDQRNHPRQRLDRKEIKGIQSYQHSKLWFDARIPDAPSPPLIPTH